MQRPGSVAANSHHQDSHGDQPAADADDCSAHHGLVDHHGVLAAWWAAAWHVATADGRRHLCYIHQHFYANGTGHVFAGLVDHDDCAYDDQTCPILGCR
jgi:hypothetical protein